MNRTIYLVHIKHCGWFYWIISVGIKTIKWNYQLLFYSIAFKKNRLQIEARTAERAFELVNLNRFRIKIGKWPIELENLNEVEYGVEHKFIVIIDVIASVNTSHLKGCVPFRLRFEAMTVTRGICQSINMNYPGDRVHFALHLSIKRNNSNCYPLERCCRVDEMSLQYWLITIKKRIHKKRSKTLCGGTAKAKVKMFVCIKCESGKSFHSRNGTIIDGFNWIEDDKIWTPTSDRSATPFYDFFLKKGQNTMTLTKATKAILQSHKKSRAVSRMKPQWIVFAYVDESKQ